MSSEKFETLDEGIFLKHFFALEQKKFGTHTTNHNVFTLLLDVSVLVDILLKKRETKLDSSHGEEKKQVIQDLERGCDEARQTLFEMEVEARAAPGAFRSEMMARVRKHQETINKLSQSIKNARKSEMNMINARETLFENRYLQ